MPAVYLSQSEKARNKNKRFHRWLRGEMAAKKKKITDLSVKLEKPLCTLYRNMEKEKPFTYPEMLQIFDFIEADKDTIEKWMRI